MSEPKDVIDWQKVGFMLLDALGTIDRFRLAVGIGIALEEAYEQGRTDGPRKAAPEHGL